MSKKQYPHEQPFNVTARPCRSKKGTNSWWSSASRTYWRNANKKKDA